MQSTSVFSLPISWSEPEFEELASSNLIKMESLSLNPPKELVWHPPDEEKLVDQYGSEIEAGR